MFALLLVVAMVAIALVGAWGQAALSSVRAQNVADALVLAAVDAGEPQAHLLADRTLDTMDGSVTYQLFQVKGITHALVEVNGQQAVAAAVR